MNRSLELGTSPEILYDDNRKCYFLGIGINTYKFIKDLKNPQNDILELKSKLTQYYRFKEEDCYTLLNENATRAKIMSSLRSFVDRLTERDNFVIFLLAMGDMMKIYLWAIGFPIMLRLPMVSNIPGFRILIF